MNLLNYVIFIAVWWLLCFAYFQLIQKPLFGTANRHSCPEKITVSKIGAVFRRGYISDAIVASYLTAIPLIIGLLHTLIPSMSLRVAMLPYNIISALAIGLLTLSDTVLYGFWGTKIDASVFAYLRHPKGAFASVSTGYLAAAMLAVLILSAIFFCGAEAVTYFCAGLTAKGPQPWWVYAGAPLAFVIMTGACFAIIRGLKIRPNNPSVVYFSPVAFFNHWALNPAYNLIYSLGTQNEYGGKFRFFTPEECRSIVEPLYPTGGKPAEQLLKTARPNILFIVWESFGAEFCGALGGKQDVTPCFDALCREGVLFTDCRASSFRTDRALPAIFCGLPGQPTASIVRHTRKLPNLPALPRDLREQGYETTALHGGELTIMHKSDFYLSSGHSRVIAEKDLPGGLDKGKWGIHDGPVMRWLYDDIQELTRRGAQWMTTLQTLSSHEPFIVPYNRLADPADNSMAYTDASLGELVTKLKNSPAWNNLLIVITGDHGLNRSHQPADRNLNSRIPLLLCGGAVKEPRTIDKIVCQTDIAATLLGQMGLDHSHFPWSRDVLAPTYTTESSMHTYIDGFLFTDSSGYTDYDNVAGRAVNGTGDKARERRGKAILQSLYEYIDKL